MTLLLTISSVKTMFLEFSKLYIKIKNIVDLGDLHGRKWSEIELMKLQQFILLLCCVSSNPMHNLE
jgi:hypothetical protein